MHTCKHLRFRLWLLVVATASLPIFASVTCAQIPGLPQVTQPKAGSPPKAEAQESAEQTRARVRKLLDDAREQSERPAQPVPAGIEPREIAELREAQLKLVIFYDVQLRTLDQLDRARAARQAAEARERDWTGFDTPPPYSIVVLDQLRDDADVARTRIGLLEAAVARLRLDAGRAQDDLRRAEEDARRAEDALGSASAPEDKTRAAWRLDLARVKGRAAAATAAVAALVTQFRGDDLATRRAELELLERQVAVASQNTTFTEADVATARKRIDDQIEVERRERDAIDAQADERLRQRDAAKEALAQAQHSAKATAAERATAQARVEAADARVDSLRDQSDALQGLIVLDEQTSAAWGARYTVFHGPDPEAKRIAAAKLREGAQRSANWKVYTESLVREARAKLADVEAELTATNVAPGEVRYQQDALAARRGALLARERLESALDATSRQLGLWVADLDTAKEQRDLRARLVDAWLALRDRLRTVWNFELFAVEDTTVAAGQSITISRGVTVGKSIGALLVFLLGYWVIAASARGIERRLVARGFDAARSRTARRWVLALWAVLLLLLTLNVARIPFTVFAFLGGALAIGAGFGTQTLIKNLVSGMVVLMERQVRVGDIVDVENVSGTITEVNLRSSTVRGFDGVEAIVPNSVFIENKVTNWTHSDRKVRRVVKVGVTYGSPVREVDELLQECAKRHGLVLADPPPLVIFEDFGDSALHFALYIWVELRPGVNSLQVMSDVRFMIEKTFAEAGIVMAYPQRDLHLDAPKPLRVELVREQKLDQPAPIAAVRPAAGRSDG